MSPTPEELELGKKAYEQVRFYEKVTSKDIHSIPWIFLTCAGLMLLIVILEAQHHGHTSLLLLIFIPACFTLLILQNWAAKARHATNKLLLKLLGEKYGDPLPWVAEEKLLASARELEAAIARDLKASHA
jgi:hypothetical protein